MIKARIPTQTRTVIVMLTVELPRVAKKFVGEEEADAGAADVELDCTEGVGEVEGEIED